MDDDEFEELTDLIRMIRKGLRGIGSIWIFIFKLNGTGCEIVVSFVQSFLDDSYSSSFDLLAHCIVQERGLKNEIYIFGSMNMKMETTTWIFLLFSFLIYHS